MIQFFILKLHFGGLHFTNSPKFELRIPQEGMVYKIWNLMYKIVQNEYKIMIQFFMLKLHFGWLHVTSPPPILIADSARGNVVQNLGFGVQNCTK